MTEHLDSMATITAALLDDLRDELGVVDLEYAAPPEPLGGGFYAEIFAIRLEGGPELPADLRGELVARIMPDAELGRRETIVQREVAASGFPAPAVRVAGDGKALGLSYMVMDRVDGAPLLSGLTAAKAVVSLPRVIRRLPRLLSSCALELHLLDPAPIVDALEREVPNASIDTADMLTNLTTSANELQVALLQDATRWLADNQPEPERVSICHGDLHPFNLIVDDEGGTSLVDWTASRVSEPAFDLAFTTLMINNAPIDIPRSLQRPIRAAAGGLATDVVETYRELARPHGITLEDDRLAWYTALHCTRVLAELESWEDTRTDHPFHTMAPNIRAQLAAAVRS